ncbi:SsgA family sporulation/cell division regulator [Streptomyces halobius]|uniref:SsgA family sporulation/cell division regulator n=1 Tax=Streptomyces halobius TaxID=2879846 RepID=A0ABY4MBS9_9ACTN|nr:SsgA family sporulation/cell division regulator [Streptomyces halobius]UQA95241.1 SsgA family sporulation/cell division regulator [Streptomyces halobius]
MVSTAQRTLEMWLLLGPDAVVPVAGRCSYRSDRPYEVEVAFISRGRTIATWQFARDLLLDGLDGEAGEGDVRVRPVHGPYGQRHVHIDLSTDDTVCALSVRATELTSWLEQTTAIVPPGQESRHVDMDVHLARLLAGKC